MTDYQPLIARAVEGLDRNTGEGRRALYERARTALVSQLRAVEPALSESEITKERLALEDAIRKVEAEAARKLRPEPRPAAPPRRERPPADAVRAEPRRADSGRAEPRPAAAEEDRAARTAPPSARERLLNARAPGPNREGFRGLRSVVNEANDLGGAAARSAQSAREARDSYAPPYASQAPAAASFNDVEPEFGVEDASADFDDARQSYGREPHDEWSEEHTAHYGARHQPPALAEEQPARLPRSYRGLVQLAVVLVVVAGLAATIPWVWPYISGLYHSVTQIGSRPPSQNNHEATVPPKIDGRVPQEQAAGQPATGSGAAQSVPAVAQRAVLYEEDSNNTQGKQFAGSVIWRTDTVSPGPGLAPELVVRADVEIPERRVTMTWSLRRNTDPNLPASHTIEIQFNLPADFPGGGIANVPGVLMKQSEQARGTPLAGLAVKVTNGFFLIGLSAVDADLQRNLQLLKERPWFDIPVLYTNGGRAILAIEKGAPGDRAFADAFAAWEKK
jgi:hypothetical protein